ncbi:MBL fold metallo-hydrolase [Scytonema hofmannii PCC 7110]|uniref:MBL fold metallo-hydrolase n=1 Tax=Scytonema hofmannii PCC 7110 TaxID=128403 RepID=A0A139XCS4_9CYAN|nr:MBL fold metallo-hydrolase [Scytonema hofmannii]KYC42501.1 MBL fold metallo-hydrolase [Scytonema hofmannii PCC 7110]
MCPLPQESSNTAKSPRAIFSNEVPVVESLGSDLLPDTTIFAFPPNRDTLGGTAYFIVRNEGNILIDCPAVDTINQNFLHSHRGVSYFFLTHRGAIGKTEEIQRIFNCKILIQEQEAYLLPGLTVTTFGQEFTLDSTVQMIWTPGHSPGSSCLYYKGKGGVLFSGRHVLPNLQGDPEPLRTAKTFHWWRQIESIKLLLKNFTPETLHYICPGANTGFLRGQRFIDNAYERLREWGVGSGE